MMDGASDAPDPMEKAIARARKLREEHGRPTEMERILAIPVIERSVERDAEAAARWTRILRRPGGTAALKPLQGIACDEAVRAAATGSLRSPFVPIGVGHGKTLLSLVLPEVMYAERPLLLHPPSMRRELAEAVALWSPHFDFRPPQTYAYSELSQSTATSFLDWYRPDLIIADEAHALRHATASRTKRVVRYLKANPTCRFVPLSGTMTARSLLDYDHLIELSLREFAPIPLSRKILEQWASVIDPEGEPDQKSWDAIWPLAVAFGNAPKLWQAGTSHGVEVDGRVLSIREGYQRRLSTTPGVVVSREPSVGSNLWLVRRHTKVPSTVANALEGLIDTWNMPDENAAEGAEIADAAALARAGTQLSCGFYYVWDWTWNGKRGGKTEDDDEWLLRRSEWHKAVRNILRYSSRTGLDSPMLVAHWVKEGHGGHDITEAYARWVEDGPDGKPYRDRKQPPKKTIWVSKFLMDDVVEWAIKHKECLLWYSSLAVETALVDAGIPVFGAGSESPTFEKTPIAACSIAVHGKGKNLQKWFKQVVIEPPSSGAVWEQLLGRTHRQGQMADDVFAVVYQHTEKALNAVKKACAEAMYIEQTQGMKQKLNLAKWADTEDIMKGE